MSVEHTIRILNDLLDVDTTGLADGDTLVYDSATNQFKPGTAGGGGGGGGGYVGSASWTAANTLAIAVQSDGATLTFDTSPAMSDDTSWLTFTAGSDVFTVDAGVYAVRVAALVTASDIDEAQISIGTDEPTLIFGQPIGAVTYPSSGTWRWGGNGIIVAKSSGSFSFFGTSQNDAVSLNAHSLSMALVKIA